MRTLAALALVTAALAVPTSAWAYGSEVSAYGCYLNGGNVSRPAGTDIVVRQGWATATQRQSFDFIRAQRTFISVNGGRFDDVIRDWTTPRLVSPGWVTWVFYPTTVTLAAGESMQFRYVSALTRRVYDGAGYAGPGITLDVKCTVTGV